MVIFDSFQTKFISGFLPNCFLERQFLIFRLNFNILQNKIGHLCSKDIFGVIYLSSCITIIIIKNLRSVIFSDAIFTLVFGQRSLHIVNKIPVSCFNSFSFIVGGLLCSFWNDSRHIVHISFVPSFEMVRANSVPIGRMKIHSRRHMNPKLSYQLFFTTFPIRKRIKWKLTVPFAIVKATRSAARVSTVTSRPLLSGPTASITIDFLWDFTNDIFLFRRIPRTRVLKKLGLWFRSKYDLNCWHFPWPSSSNEANQSRTNDFPL